MIISGLMLDELKRLAIKREDELVSLRASLAESQAALCRAKALIPTLEDGVHELYTTKDKWGDVGNVSATISQIAAALSSPSPCPHKARVKELEERFFQDRIKLLESNNETWQKIVNRYESRVHQLEDMTANYKPPPTPKPSDGTIVSHGGESIWKILDHVAGMFRTHRG